MKGIKDRIKELSPTISNQELNEILSLFTSKKLSKGTILVNQNKVNHKFYVLLSGVARDYLINEKGKEYMRLLYLPVSLLGGLPALISEAPANSTYDCITDCTVLEASYPQFINLTKKHHAVAMLYNRILERVMLKEQERVIDLLTLNATNRYLKIKNNFPTLEELIPQHYIASFLNITPIQLSRIRKNLYSK